MAISGRSRKLNSQLTWPGAKQVTSNGSGQVSLVIIFNSLKCQLDKGAKLLREALTNIECRLCRDKQHWIQLCKLNLSAPPNWHIIPGAVIYSHSELISNKETLPDNFRADNEAANATNLSRYELGENWFNGFGKHCAELDLIIPVRTIWLHVDERELLYLLCWRSARAKRKCSIGSWFCLIMDSIHRSMVPI